MALIPFFDENPLRSIQFQIVTVALILFCVALFLWTSALPSATGAYVGFGLISYELFGGNPLYRDAIDLPPLLNLITYMFLHSSWLHLIGNMLYLWVFGDNIEDAMGHGRFLLFFLLCGIIAALCQALIDPDSTIPLVGASGAISGLLGAYLMLHPRARVLLLFFPFKLPAYVVLGLWVAFQLYNVLIASTGHVAWWAHIGGFIAGALLVIPFRRPGVRLFS